MAEIPEMLKKPVNHGISTTNLNWLTPDFSHQQNELVKPSPSCKILQVLKLFQSICAIQRSLKGKWKCELCFHFIYIIELLLFVYILITYISIFYYILRYSITSYTVFDILYLDAQVRASREGR